jgi:hypothetical protein
VESTLPTGDHASGWGDVIVVGGEIQLSLSSIAIAGSGSANIDHDDDAASGHCPMMEEHGAPPADPSAHDAHHDM